MDWIILLSEKCIWFGFAALGFGVLFNVPSRSLIPIFILGALGGFTKVVMMHFEINIVVSSLFGAALIGFLSIPFAHLKHAPPPIFAIPAVIPMVPGVFAYRMMLGLIDLASDKDPETYSNILSLTTHNGLKVMFILMSLAIGVALPMLVTRKESAKQIRFRNPIKRN
ncbi:threonine/serine exporter family protein [Pedobacter sp. AW31-3R]|uniref:threonine/serine exporter family protein n=1 Tax=Pedobacter sp. AW31-3R TaxID=3445781 RepID=UPI003FA08BDA